MASIESVNVNWIVRSFQHRLTLDSFIITLPAMFAQAKSKPMSKEDRGYRLEVRFGDCMATGVVRPESGKLLINANGMGSNLLQTLRALAAENGLSDKNLRLIPVIPMDRQKGIPNYVSFDQVISSTEFEEVFRWRFLDWDADAQSVRRVWSDILTFWSDSEGSLFSIELETRIRTDARRWYVVFSERPSGLKVFWCRQVG